jgi:hypothetical protein
MEPLGKKDVKNITGKLKHTHDLTFWVTKSNPVRSILAVECASS